MAMSIRKRVLGGVTAVGFKVILAGTLWSGGTVAALAADASFVSLAVTQTEDKITTEGDEGTDQVTILNLSVGVGVGSGLVLGARYFDFSQDNEFLDSDKVVTSGWGPMIGYLHETFQGGNGYVIDLGKVWKVGNQFGVGLQLSKSHVGYEEVKSNDGKEDLNGDWSDESLYPYLSLFVFF
jgi:hypothetical protein